MLLRKTTNWVKIPALPDLSKHCLSARSSPKHALWGQMPTPARSRPVEQFCQAPGHSSQLRSHTQFQAPATSPDGHLGASWALETSDQALSAQSWLGRFRSKPSLPTAVQKPEIQEAKMQRRPQTPIFPRHRAPSCFHSGVGRNCLCMHAAPCLKKAPVQSGNPGGVLTQDSSRGSCFTLIKQSSVFPFSVGFIQVLTTSIETDLPE